MKWVGISGTWKKIDERVERDVRNVVREIFEREDGIVSGGALGVDYIATDEALKFDSCAERIKICLPVSLDKYCAHYGKRAREGVITSSQAEMLIGQLMRIDEINGNAIVENLENEVVDRDSYFERNREVVELSDELVSFRVNESEGTGDTILKAREKGIGVREFIYNID